MQEITARTGTLSTTRLCVRITSGVSFTSPSSPACVTGVSLVPRDHAPSGHPEFQDLLLSKGGAAHADQDSSSVDDILSPPWAVMQCRGTDDQQESGG